MGGLDDRTDAKEELRLQLGTLRFDIKALSEKLGKDQRKEIKAASKDFYAAVRMTWSANCTAIVLSTVCQSSGISIVETPKSSSLPQTHTGTLAPGTFCMPAVAQ